MKWYELIISAVIIALFAITIDWYLDTSPSDRAGMILEGFTWIVSVVAWFGLVTPLLFSRGRGSRS